MASCLGCLKEGVEGYCRQCIKRLFDGKKVNYELSFTRPEYNRVKLEQTERLSISGVQSKHSLMLEGRNLKLTNKSGRYILKPVPNGPFQNLDYVPINENLTMQIARQLFKINTAENGLVKFKDGEYAYISKRFDVKLDGSKFLQEDMAQAAGRSIELNGRNYKYDYSYEEIAGLLKKYVGAYPVEVEKFYKVILFNYLYCNGDAHLKNFSIYREEEFGSYILTPSYDLLNTRIHVPGDADTALELFKNSYMTDEYKAGSIYTKADFKEFGARIGMKEKRVQNILEDFTDTRQQVSEIVTRSMLSNKLKIEYLSLFVDRLRRITN